MGIRRTIMRCKERFFWPKMIDSISNFVQIVQLVAKET